MRRVLLAAGILLSASTAHAWTQAEIAAAVATIDVADDRKCLASGGGELVQKVEARDLNGDGIDEIIVTTGGTKGGVFCFGRIGQRVALLLSDGTGKWHTQFDFPADGLTYQKRTDSAWPDLEIQGPGTCQPVWRMGTGKYDLYQACENGKRVLAKSDAVKPAAQPSSIGSLVPVEVINTALDGPPYDHNGSIMLIDADKGVIVYDRPKKSIAGTVKPGTVLFRGQPWQSGDTDIVIKGTAYAFKAGCPAAAYEVRGTYHPLHGISQLTLQGAAPVRSKTSCEVVGHTAVGPNSKLVFDIALE